MKKFEKWSDKAVLSLSYPEFISKDNTFIKDTLNKIVQEAVGILQYSQHYKKYIAVDPEELLNDLGEMNEFENVPFESNSEVKVILNKKGILTLEFLSYEYTGGAHGNGGRTYDVFDLTQEKKITLDELFVQNYLPKLTWIAERYFRKARKLLPNESLADAGFFVFNNNGFELNRNFAIVKEGIKFLFNAYEIASYAHGITEFVIPFGELKDIISEESIIKRFIK